MNAIIQGREKMDYNADCNIIATEVLRYKDRPVFGIGHESKSCTETPGFYQEKGLYFVDCPGLQDQDKLKEYPNQTSVHLIQKDASASLLLFVTSPDHLTVNRGALFVQQVTGILRYLSPKCDKADLEKIIVPVFLKYRAMRMPKVVTNRIDKVIEAILVKFM